MRNYNNKWIKLRLLEPETKSWLKHNIISGRREIIRGKVKNENF